MRNSRSCVSALVCLGATLVLLMALPLSAQLPTASILGTVKDASGGSVPGATITIKNTDTGFTRTVTTGSDGTFDVPELATGHYQVQTTHTGFKSETRSGITLEVTQQAVINFTLEVGTTEQQVVVTGEAPIVNTTDATLGGLVNETSIKDLPLNGRNYIDLSLLQAGVTRDVNIGDSNNGGGGGFGTSFSVNGAPDRSNNFTLDGAILQNQFGRNPSTEGDTTLGVEGIKEYKVITTNFAAEYGLTMGSQMVMVSSGGTNALHGDVFYFMRNAALDAKNFFDKTSKPEFQRNNYGGSFGGPIKKDKTFFFGVFEGLRQNLGVTNLLNVPAAGCHAAGGAVINSTTCPDLLPNTTSATIDPGIAPFLALYPNPNLPSPGPGLPAQFTFPSTSTAHENYGQIRVDQNLSPSDTFFARYTIDDDVLNNAPQQGFPNFRSGTNQRNQYITLSENHIFSPAVLNTARFSFSRTKFSSNPILQGLPNNDQGPGIIPGRIVGEISVGAYPNLGEENETTTYGTQNIYTLSDDLTITRGKHGFKFGTLLNRWNEGTQSNNGYNGMLRFNSFAQFVTSTPNLVEFEPISANENRDYIYDTLGFYAQDDWRLTSRLTWNVGIRYEFMTTPFERTGHSSRLLNVLTDPFTIGPTLQNNSLHDFSPRIGVAWDVFGNGKTAIRSGFGMYYDVGNIGTTLKQDSIGNPPFASLADFFSDGTTFVPIPLTQSILGTQSNLTPQFVDYHSKSPYLIQYNLSIQQQLPWDMALGVAYVGTRGIHIFTIKDSNPFQVTNTGPCGDPASACVNGVVQFWDTGSPNYGVNYNPNMPSTIEVTTAADSHYNGLQVVLNKRVGHGLEFQSAYTYSKVIDDTQGQANFADCQSSIGLQGVDPFHPFVDRGPACFDSRHNWQFNMLYHFPSVMSGNGFAAKAANGWWVSSIVSVQSGYPYSVIMLSNRSNSGVLQGQQDRANVNTPALIAKYFNPSVCTSQPGQAPAGANPCVYTPIPFNKNTVTIGKVNDWFNADMFSISPQFLSPASEQGGAACPCSIGQLGTSGRDMLYGPGSRNWNFSLVKDTKVGFLGEAGSVQFRAEFFNLLNHPNFLFQNFVAFVGAQGDLGPFSEAPRATASQITQTLPNNQREIQFALKILF